MLTPSQLLDILLLPAFYLALGSWVVVSLVLLLRGLAGGRRALALARARQRLQEIADRRLDPESEQSALVALVATLPESILLPLGAGAPDEPGTRGLAETIVARLGRSALEQRSATPGHPRHNNRRIAAMQVLALARAPGVTTVLARAVDDRDPEIVGASLALLGRVPDETAAAALIDALKQAKYSPSRVATYLDRFERPIGADLRPLLHHPDPNVRYWGATLLSRHPVDGIDRDLAALAADSAPLVRKAAVVASLAQIGGPSLAPVARRLLADQTWFVRAHAARALASTGDADIAEEIAPLLADHEWWVRLAAKESLQLLGDEVWSVLVPYLDHEDGFARNGAAEVLQNIGVLDSLIVLEAVTAKPSTAKLEMLRKIASAGGTRMTAALLERVDARTRPRVRALLETLGLEPAGVES